MSSRRPGAVAPRAALLALLALAACGGGGAAAPTGPVAPTALGLVSLTTPSTWMRAFRNPLAVPAGVTQTTAAGSPFVVGAGALPAAAPAGGDVQLPVVFTPTSPGHAEGTVALAFTAGAQSGARSETFSAQVEAVTWAVSPPALDFGAVLPGDAADRSVLLTNQSSLSPVTLTGATLPAAVTLPGTTFPVVIAPGQSRSFTVRHAPTAPGAFASTLVLGPADLGAGVGVALTGGTANAEEVTDFGAVALSGSPAETATLQVNVPADAISLSLEALGGTSDSLGLGLLTGPGGVVYENASLTGAYLWNTGDEIFSATVPNTDQPGVQLVAGGGTYSFRIRRMGGSATSVAVRAIVERRPGGTTSTGTLDLNVWLAQGLSVSAATAAGDATLQAVLMRIDTILGAQGVHLGAIDYYDVDDATYDYVTNAEFAGLLRRSAAATAQRLNLFFVIEALGGGVVGVAGTIAGPKRNGTGVSGVMSVYQGYSTSTVGLVAAHEIGHFVGLYHTVEQSGAHDFMIDTVECPASGTSAACPTAGGGYLMHWQAVGGTALSNGQGVVVRGHPILSPGPLPGSPKPSTSAAALLAAPSAAELAELEALGGHWCGTCCPHDDVTKPGR